MASMSEPRTDLAIRIAKIEVLIPAEPTHESQLFLSSLDHAFTFPASYVYFYDPPAAENRDVNVVGRLKEALQKVLVSYHFLAGRLKLNSNERRMEIHCSRDGVLFAEAFSDLSLAELGQLSCINPGYKSLIVQPAEDNNFEKCPLATMQVTKFRCGGFALGVCITHASLDGLAQHLFIMNWVSMARNRRLIFQPVADRSCFKARVPRVIKYDHPEYFKPDLITPLTSSMALKPELSNFAIPSGYTRSLFPCLAEMIEKLRQKIMKEAIVKKCTAFEVLAALIWKAKTMAADFPDDHPSKMFFAVNIRPKMKPPLQIEFAGNGIAHACCIESARAVRQSSLSFCVEKVQDAARRLTEDYLKSSIDFWETYKSPFAREESIVLTDWRRFKFEDLDFGIGSPVFAGPTIYYPVEFVILMRSSITKGELQINIALKNQQLLQFRQFLYHLCPRL